MDETPNTQTSDYRLEVWPAQMITGLVVAAAMLLLVHAVLTVYHYGVQELEWIPWRQLFDVDEENNLPTWFSGLLAGITAFWLWLQASAARDAADRWALHWKVLAIGFFLISLDEVAGLHESVNSITDTTWAIPGGILALLIGLSYFSFLWHLPTATRNMFLLAGAIFVGGAVGVEMIGAPMVEDAMPYNLLTVVEEGMEMGGVILFLWALLKYMTRHRRGARRITVDVTVSGTAASPSADQPL